jgi:hypothetical protein
VPESMLAPLPFAPDQSGRRNPRSATGDTTSGTHRLCIAMHTKPADRYADATIASLRQHGDALG